MGCGPSSDQPVTEPLATDFKVKSKSMDFFKSLDQMLEEKIFWFRPPKKYFKMFGVWLCAFLFLCKLILSNKIGGLIWIFAKVKNEYFTTKIAPYQISRPQLLIESGMLNTHFSVLLVLFVLLWSKSKKYFRYFSTIVLRLKITPINNLLASRTINQKMIIVVVTFSCHSAIDICVFFFDFVTWYFSF